MLVVAVVFAVTRQLDEEALKPVTLAAQQADAEPLETQQGDEPLVLTVLQNGDLYLNAGGDLAGTTSGLIDPESLVTTVAAIVRRNPEVQVLVGGDQAVGYGQGYNAMVLLQKAGVSKVGLMSDPLDTGLGEDGG